MPNETNTNDLNERNSARLRPVGTRFVTEVEGENGTVLRHTWKVVGHVAVATLPDGTTPILEDVREVPLSPEEALKGL